MILLRQNLFYCIVVVFGIAAMLAYRAVYVEPERWGAVCDLAPVPLACLPRQGLLWLQSLYLWGTGALVLGLIAFFGRRWRVGVVAVVIGADAVINYNATWGMIGAALGGWSWLMEMGRR
jgi:hypothetical protein